MKRNTVGSDEGGRARAKVGRPRLPNARTSVFSVAVSAVELARLRSADAKTWAREALLRSLRRRRGP